ncbi:MAG: helix-turn-helix domain-containing protein [Dehalococcoidia bacterium]
MSPLHPSTVERAAVHAALGDPHRLQLCDELVLCDRSPSDLAERLDLRSNLLAHHLLVLTRAGVIETVRSAGDGRRRYVRLRREAFERLQLPVPTLRPASLLFVCSANSARSPLAVAIWREISDLPAQSAGTRPAERVHPQAVAAGARQGLDLSGMAPRAFQAIDDGTPALVVTVCDEANEQLAVPRTQPRLHWSIPDPAASGDPHAFDSAIATLRERVKPLREAIALATAMNAA